MFRFLMIGDKVELSKPYSCAAERDAEAKKHGQTFKLDSDQPIPNNECGVDVVGDFLIGFSYSKWPTYFGRKEVFRVRYNKTHDALLREMKKVRASSKEKDLALFVLLRPNI